MSMAANFIHPWEPVNSSWIVAIAFVERGNGSLAVWYRDNAIPEGEGIAPGEQVVYRKTDEGDFLAMRRSRSKGRWARRHLYNLDYEFV